MKLYDLFEIAEWDGKADDDPHHRTVELWRGVDVAERHLGFSLEDLALIFRYARPAAIWHLFAIGAHYAAWAADDPRIRSGSHSVVLSPEIKTLLEPTGAGLRELLRKAKECTRVCDDEEPT